MCGVSGIYAPRFAPVDRAAVVRMTRTLVHRGPDEEGFHFALGIGLGHRRLSIVDLASGQQPLCNEDRTIWVAFNGEIFNYLELRRDLVARGHQFSTSSDTETIVHAYEQFGLQFVEHLNGQFAIALWDERARRLLLVRDRVGILPLSLVWSNTLELDESALRPLPIPWQYVEREAHDRGAYLLLLTLERDTAAHIGALGMLDGTPLGSWAQKKAAPEPEEPAPDDGDAADGAEGEGAAAEPAEPPLTAEDARRMGAEAAQGGKPVTANPFPARDPRRAAWDEAWCQNMGSDGMDIPEALRPKPKAKKGDQPGSEGEGE